MAGALVASAASAWALPARAEDPFRIVQVRGHAAADGYHLTLLGDRPFPYRSTSDVDGFTLELPGAQAGEPSDRLPATPDPGGTSAAQAVAFADFGGPVKAMAITQVPGGVRVHLDWRWRLPVQASASVGLIPVAPPPADLVPPAGATPPGKGDAPEMADASPPDGAAPDPGDAGAHVAPPSPDVPPDAGYALELTFPTTFEEASSSLVAAGVRHTELYQGTPAGPRTVHVLDVDLSAPGVRVSPALANPVRAEGCDPVPRIVERAGAVAGVNGSYFSMRTGEPSGLLVLGGELVAGPRFNRAALVQGDAGVPFVDHVQQAGDVSLPDGQGAALDGVNASRQGDQLIRYTPVWGRSTGTPPGGAEVALRGDTVVAVGDHDLEIPADGWVLSAGGHLAPWLASLKVGDRVTYRFPLAEVWRGLSWAVGGGPELLRGGQVVVDPARENFPADIARGSAPRTAAGIAGSHLLLVTVDGRDPKRSIGATLPDLAALLARLGATDALNLDGGGSTTMVVGGHTVNRPSDGICRAVNNALLVYAPPSAPAPRAASLGNATP